MSSATWIGTPSILGSSDVARMALLTVCLAGVQFTWGIEMAYCTPYLLSLGISKSKTSLIWIAGPLSGLITQPIVGALADQSRLRWGRRRPFMIVGSILVTFGLLILGWTKEFVSLFTSDKNKASHATVVVAVLAIYALDFAVNAVQASCRAIIVDTLPIPKQQHGSAWASRMIAFGHILSYLAGTLDLVGFFGVWFLGDTQFKKLCIISSVALLVTVGLTAYAVTERVLVSPREEDVKVGVFHIFVVIWKTLWTLPNRIRAICFIQFFAWLGWFPFLFYSSTWVGEVYHRYDETKVIKDKGDRPKDAVGDIARVGSMALVVFSFVSLTSSITLPWVVRKPPRAPGQEKQSSSNKILQDFHRITKPYKPSLETTWLVSHIMFAASLLYSVFVSSLTGATILVAVCGVPWAIAVWAPFAMLGEEINRINHGSDRGRSLLRGHDEAYDPLHQVADEDAFKSDDDDSESDSNDNDVKHERKAISPAPGLDEQDPTDVEMGTLMAPSTRAIDPTHQSPALPVVATPNHNDEVEPDNSSTGELSGIYLGIMNLFITLPQFVGSFIAFVVFAILEPGQSPELAGEGIVGGVTSGNNTITHRNITSPHSNTTMSNSTLPDGGKTVAGASKGVNAIAVTMFIGGFGSIVAAYRTWQLKKVR